MGAQDRSYPIPQTCLDLVGTTQKFSGGLFSGNKSLPESDYKVHDVRWGTALVINFKEMQETCKSSYRHPTVEYLLSNPNMKRKQWTRGFAVREINLKED